MSERIASDLSPSSHSLFRFALLALCVSLLGRGAVPCWKQGLLLNLGNCLLVRALSEQSGRLLDRAGEVLRGAERVRGPTSGTSRSLCRLYWEVEEFDDMALALAEGLTSVPKDPMLLYRAGEFYWATGRVELAVDAWRRAGAAPLFFGQAAEAVSVGDVDQALSKLDIAIRIEPWVSDAYYLQARILEGQGHWAAALDKYAQAVRNATFVWQTVSSDVLLSRAYVGLGYATYRTSGGLDEAVSALEKALEINPAEDWAYLRLCDVYGLAGETARALEWCNEAVWRMRDDHWPYYSRGRALAHAGEYERAARDFEVALALRPSYGPAQRELQRMLQHLSGE